VIRLALAALTALCACACVPRPSNPDDARLIVAQFVTARQARDLEAAMACFIDQPEMRSSQGVGWTGREAVRAIMAYRITDNYTVGDLHVSGDRVTWSEHVTRVPQAPPSPGAGRAPAIFDEDVEAVIVGGRIASLTTSVAGVQRADSRLSGAPSIATSLLVPLLVLVLVASAVLIWPTGSSMRVASASAANGRLMSQLREYVARRG
jgi:hypothetical protein